MIPYLIIAASALFAAFRLLDLTMGEILSEDPLPGSEYLPVYAAGALLLYMWLGTRLFSTA